MRVLFSFCAREIRNFANKGRNLIGFFMWAVGEWIFATVQNDGVVRDLFRFYVGNRENKLKRRNSIRLNRLVNVFVAVRSLFELYVSFFKIIFRLFVQTIWCDMEHVFVCEAETNKTEADCVGLQSRLFATWDPKTERLNTRHQFYSFFPTPILEMRKVISERNWNNRP